MPSPTVQSCYWGVKATGDMRCARKMYFNLTRTTFITSKNMNIFICLSRKRTNKIIQTKNKNKKIQKEKKPKDSTPSTFWIFHLAKWIQISLKIQTISYSVQIVFVIFNSNSQSDIPFIKWPNPSKGTTTHLIPLDLLSCFFGTSNRILDRIVSHFPPFFSLYFLLYSVFS